MASQAKIDANHVPPLGHSYQDAIDPFLRIERHIDGTNRMYPVGAAQLVRAKPDARPEPASQEETKPLTNQLALFRHSPFAPAEHVSPEAFRP